MACVHRPEVVAVTDWVTECPDPGRWVERIQKGVKVNDHGCWVWTGSLDRNGYGRFKATICGRKRNFSAHRAAWLCLRGSIPYPLIPDHLCRNRACCNPEHMELVSNSVNVLRGDHSRKKGRSGRRAGVPGCGKHGLADGHYYNGTDGYAHWVCRTCARSRRRERRSEST